VSTARPARRADLPPLPPPILLPPLPPSLPSIPRGARRAVSTARPARCAHRAVCGPACSCCAAAAFPAAAAASVCLPAWLCHLPTAPLARGAGHRSPTQCGRCLEGAAPASDGGRAVSERLEGAAPVPFACAAAEPPARALRNRGLLGVCVWHWSWVSILYLSSPDAALAQPRQAHVPCWQSSAAFAARSGSACRLQVGDAATICATQQCMGRPPAWRRGRAVCAVQSPAEARAHSPRCAEAGAAVRRGPLRDAAPAGRLASES